MNLTSSQVAQLMDASVLKTTSTKQDVQELIDACKKYEFKCAYVLSSYMPMLSKGLDGAVTLRGGAVGFPSGADTTATKVFAANEFKEMGCTEFDMVMNVGFLKSGMFDDVSRDIKAVREATRGYLLKVIVESMYLSEAQLRDASKLVLDSGADFIKTGTGWASDPCTKRHIEIMANVTGGKLGIKASGGVRDYAMVEEMVDMGVTRFGVGLANASAIVETAIAKER